MAAAESPETFTLLPLHLNPESKAVSTQSSDPILQTHLEDLNKLSRQILSLDTPNQAIPPPAPVNPKRSVQITKLRESASTAYKKSLYTEAIALYDLAIKMATDRPSWEASGLVREELAVLYSNRAQARMGLREWVEGATDAECSVEMKRVGNLKAWWRRGVCLREMGRWGEGVEWVGMGVGFERGGPEREKVGELEGLLRELEGGAAKV